MDATRLSRLAAAVAFAVVFGCSTSAAAKKFMVGLKGGGNLATVVGGDAELPGATKKRALGFSGGAMAAINLGSFGVQPELLYSVKGVKYEADQTDGTRRIRYNYLQVPLLLRFNASLPAIPVTPKFMLGPSASFFLSGKSKATGDLGDPTEEGVQTSELDEDNQRSPYFGAIAGAGVDVGLGPGVLVVDLRYEQGLNKIAAKDAEPASRFHSSITGHVGYGIGF